MNQILREENEIAPIREIRTSPFREDQELDSFNQSILEPIRRVGAMF
jgi:hypothetical protein